jgi:hypothetical protein
MKNYDRAIFAIIIATLLFTSVFSISVGASLFNRSRQKWFGHIVAQQSRGVLDRLTQRVKNHRETSTNPTVISKIRLSPYGSNKVNKVSNYLGQIKLYFSKPPQSGGTLKSNSKFQTSNGIRCATGGSECVVPPKKPTQGSICDRLKKFTQNCITSKDTCKITCRATCKDTCSGISCNIGCSEWKPTESRFCQITSDCKLTFAPRCEKPTTAGSGGICEITVRDNGGICDPNKWPTSNGEEICEFKPTEGRFCQITSKCIKPTEGNICQKITSNCYKPTEGKICQITSQETCGIRCPKPTGVFDSECSPTTKDTCGIKCPNPTGLFDPECIPTKDSNDIFCTIGGPNCPDQPTLRGTCGIIPTICQETCQQSCSETCAQTCCATCSATSCGYCPPPPTSRYECTHQNSKPIADFTYSPEYPKVGETAQFDSTLSYDPDEQYGDHIASWIWDLDGDRNWDSDEQNPVYQYPAPGKYKVTLVVTDTKGAYDSVSKTIIVVSDRLYVTSWNFTYENTTFPVIVADLITEDGMYSPVEGAIVEFNGETNVTNESGITTYHFCSPRGRREHHF